MPLTEDRDTHQHIAVSDSHGVTLVRLLDRRLIDGRGIDDFGQELFRLIESKDRRQLVLDFSLVDFLASAALGKLIALHRKLAAKNGMMKLCSISPDIRELFAITKLDRMFHLVDNAAAAVASFG